MAAAAPVVAEPEEEPEEVALAAAGVVSADLVPVALVPVGLG